MGKTHHLIEGLVGAEIAPIAAEIIKKQKAPALVVSSSYERAKSLAQALSYFLGTEEIITLPEEEPYFLRFEAKSQAQMRARLAAIKKLANPGDCPRTGTVPPEAKTKTRRGELCSPAVVCAPISAVLKKTLPAQKILSHKFTLKTGDEADVRTLSEKLSEMGYERAYSVETEGQFSLRGGIMDIFATGDETPVRIDFFGDEIEAIKTFDPDTQKSLGKVEHVQIFPASEVLLSEDDAETAIRRIHSAFDEIIEKTTDEELAAKLTTRRDTLAETVSEGANRQVLEHYINYITDNPANLASFLPDDGILIIEDPGRIHSALELTDKETAGDYAVLLSSGDALGGDLFGAPSVFDLPKLYEACSTYYFTPFGGKPEDADRIDEKKTYEGKHPPIMGGNLAMLTSELRRYIKENYEITIVCSSDERIEGVKELLKAENIPHTTRPSRHCEERSDEAIQRTVLIEQGELPTGVELPGQKKVWLWEGDIFRSGRKKRRIRAREDRSPIRSFTDIKPGDYVVHENHGIAKYMGIEQKEAAGARRDFLVLKYSGSDTLFIPVEQMQMVQKYIGNGEEHVKLSSLSGSEWKTAKAKAKAAIAEMADELIAMTAERRARKGFEFPPDSVWQKQFEEKFPYEPTDDQLKCIEAIKKDMERPVSMDRLLCGDVGYGKTEVALRAVFKCVDAGKQAAVLVPTTILATQHFKTFAARFEDFPFTVEIVSRFVSDSQVKETIKGLKSGRVDVVIGTHRLLSKDIQYKDLGLLVIDEEQRFGVKQKEAIKELKKNVDVLTLTATPIPRTLHMSLMGLRDVDVIEEPPEDRYPVQTYVMEESGEIVREVIMRELDRGGQVYAVSARINGIDRIAGMISELVPDARVAVGHGRMNEHQLENVMQDYIDGEYDVLVSTTIIESGIDIPNVNTILIFDADRFGLSQLYQLRGRVGRTNRIAFAYLMYKKNKELTEVAGKRLRTIKEFTEFGAGFKIAMRDLEIRGAGNILGAQQSGHIVQIGYEMYCKLVDEAVAALAGIVSDEDSAEAVIDIRLEAYIPETYIESEPERLDIYKQISFSASAEEAEDMLSQLEDRFGTPPQCVTNLVYAAACRKLMQKAGIRRAFIDGPDLVLFYISQDKLNPKGIAAAVGEFGNKVSVSGAKTPAVRLKLKPTADPLDKLTTLLSCLKG